MSLSSIKGEVINECELRGYESPLEKTLIDSRFDKEILDALCSSVRKYLPDFVKYFNRKAKLLGYDKLPYYETFAPVGKGSITYTFDEAKDFVIKQYYSFSDKLGDFAKHAFENNWLDTEPREGKVGGAFCSSCSAIKESR
ncbi:MAG: oligoendopeptidase F, partial [Fenollaria timonensis]